MKTVSEMQSESLKKSTFVDQLIVANTEQILSAWTQRNPLHLAKPTRRNIFNHPSFSKQIKVLSYPPCDHSSLLPMYVHL